MSLWQRSSKSNVYISTQQLGTGMFELTLPAVPTIAVALPAVQSPHPSELAWMRQRIRGKIRTPLTNDPPEGLARQHPNSPGRRSRNETPQP